MRSWSFIVGPEHIAPVVLDKDEDGNSKETRPRKILMQRRAIIHAIGKLRDKDIGKLVYGYDGTFSDRVSVESDEQMRERKAEHKFQIIKPEHEDKQKRADEIGANIVKLIAYKLRAVELMREMLKLYEYECSLHGVKAQKEKTYEELEDENGKGTDNSGSVREAEPSDLQL